MSMLEWINTLKVINGNVSIPNKYIMSKWRIIPKVSTIVKCIKQSSFWNMLNNNDDKEKHCYCFWYCSFHIKYTTKLNSKTLRSQIIYGFLSIGCQIILEHCQKCG